MGSTMHKPENLDIINESFAQQAAGFESRSLNFTREDYLAKVVGLVAPTDKTSMLEVAAGTCAVSRAFAPHVQTTVCLDATREMLEVGRTEAGKAGLTNMVFVQGYAEDLPFLDRSFDLVASRLAFHHLTDPATALHEMARVCKPGGRVVLIDVEAPAEELRASRDQLETLRDPSHVQLLSHKEMRQLFADEHLTVEREDVTSMPTDLESWMELTKTPEATCRQIRSLMEDELASGTRTGFSPRRTDQGIVLDQEWLLLIGRK